MRIILTQTEIEEAISEKVLRQISINDNMNLKIDLSATRGQEGFTATIDVIEKPEAPLEISTKITRARRAAAKTAEPEIEPETAEPIAEDVESHTPVEPETVNEETEEEEETTAPATGSIFAKLQKPVNKPSE